MELKKKKEIIVISFVVTVRDQNTYCHATCTHITLYASFQKICTAKIKMINKHKYTHTQAQQRKRQRKAEE